VKDHARPFIVRTNNVSVRAVGTQFDVYRGRAATTVTVVEGTVAVSPAVSDTSVASGKADESLSISPNSAVGIDRGRGEMLLAAGEQITVQPATTPKPIKADVSAATSWAQHKFIFKGASLESVAKEFNLYNERHIIIRDAQLSDLKVTGIFSSTDPSSLIRFLEARPDISVTESGNEIVVSSKH
jgi:transmembrane sensor